MNLRELIEAYADAVSNWDYHDDRSDVRRQAEAVEKLNQCQKAINVQLAVAEAAIAYMEHQAESVYDPDECDLAYAQQRGKLWDRFTEARRKAKKACNSSAGEGET